MWYVFAGTQRLPANREYGVALVFLLAFCDTIASATFILALPLDLVYLATLTAKVALLAFLPHRNPGRDWRFAGLFLLFITCVLLAAIHGEGDTQMIRTLAYFAHLTCSILLLRQALFPRYIECVAMIITGYAGLFLAFNTFGLIQFVSGRALYFGGSHPNLGGEILMLAVPLAAVVNRHRLLLAAAVTTIPCLFLLQSRAALLVACLALVAWLIRHAITKRHTRAGLVSTIALSLVALSVTLNAELIAEAVLRLDDQYRGGGSGFVGRDVRWYQAWLLFEQSPLIGVGLSFFENRGLDSPHNFALYALSTMGAFGIGVIMLFAGSLISVWRRDAWTGVFLSTILLAVVFNDRFLNLNAYPFIYQLILLAYVPLSKRDNVTHSSVGQSSPIGATWAVRLSGLPSVETSSRRPDHPEAKPSVSDG